MKKKDKELQPAIKPKAIIKPKADNTIFEAAEENAEAAAQIPRDLRRFDFSTKDVDVYEAGRKSLEQREGVDIERFKDKNESDKELKKEEGLKKSIRPTPFSTKPKI